MAIQSDFALAGRLVINERRTTSGDVMKGLIIYNNRPPIAHDLSHAFRKRGLDFRIFSVSDNWPWFHRKIIRRVNRWARKGRLIGHDDNIFKSHPWDFENAMSRKLYEAIHSFRPDAVIHIHGPYFSENLWEKFPSIIKLGWWTEPDNTEGMLDRAKHFDFYNCFSIEGANVLAAHGHISRYMPHAANPSSFFDTSQPYKPIDLSFVGKWSKWRDEVIISALSVTKNIVIIGPDWIKRSKIPKTTLFRIYKGNQVWGPELNKIINASKVVLNASRFRNSDGLNMRVFETLAAGACLLTDECPELEHHFEENQELCVYKNSNDLIDKLRGLLSNDERRLTMRLSGQRKVLAHHTYDQMASALLNQIGY